MDACGDPAVGEVQRLRDTAWQAIGTATVDGAERNQSWKAWTEHNQSLYGTDAAEHEQVDATSSSRLLLPSGKESTASEVRSRFNLSKGLLSGTLPKSSFWTDVPTPENPPLPNNPLTSPSPD
jgi:hypothetical protein